MGLRLLLCVCLLINVTLLHAQIQVIANSDTIGAYNIYELTINHPVNYPNNWEDVTINCVFKGARTIQVNGFFYDNGIWKIRFAPPEAGLWSYNFTFYTPSDTLMYSGSFTCITSTQKGFIQRQPGNPFRLIYGDGTLFNGIGLEDCMEPAANGDPLIFGFDGGFSPPAPISTTDLNTYMTSYGYKGAGFNIFRWTTNNCSFKLYDSISTAGNAYDINYGKYGDTLVRSLSANKIRIWLTFFGAPVYPQIDGSNPAEDKAIEKYINYVVARYGAYVDIWELFNESSASLYYYNTITAYIRSVDPYHRLISVSDERPQLAAIDINSPHWYQKESEYQSDAVTAAMINPRKSYGKPIIFGEQGNSVQNWDTLSSERMRLRAWTAFFNEGILIFWNTSYAKNYYQTVAANIYLGPQERGYIRILQNFTSMADTAIAMQTISPGDPASIRAYGLVSDKQFLGYFHHYSSHSQLASANFNITLRKSGVVSWIDPATGNKIDSVRVYFGNQQLTTPPFLVDLAMRIQFDSVNIFNPVNQKLETLVFPNPASGTVTISGSFNGTANINIYNSVGRIVYVNKTASNTQQIDVSTLPNGIYIYQVRTSSQKQGNGKLIVAHR